MSWPVLVDAEFVVLPQQRADVRAQTAGRVDEIFVADRNGRNETQLTQFNRAYLSRAQLSPVERLPYKGADGWDVDGFFVAIGHIPNTKAFAGQIDLDSEGYIVSHGGARTSLEGRKYLKCKGI